MQSVGKTPVTVARLPEKRGVVLQGGEYSRSEGAGERHGGDVKRAQNESLRA